MLDLTTIATRLKAFEKMLYGHNYQCCFELAKVCDGTDLARANTALAKQYSTGTSTAGELMQISFNVLLDELAFGLDYRGDSAAGVHLTDNQEQQFQADSTVFQQLLQTTFDPSQTQVYNHPEIHAAVFWGFCVLLVSKQHNAIYLFEGLASD